MSAPSTKSPDLLIEDPNCSPPGVNGEAPRMDGSAGKKSRPGISIRRRVARAPFRHGGSEPAVTLAYRAAETHSRATP